MEEWLDEEVEIRGQLVNEQNKGQEEDVKLPFTYVKIMAGWANLAGLPEPFNEKLQEITEFPKSEIQN